MTQEEMALLQKSVDLITEYQRLLDKSHGQLDEALALVNRFRSIAEKALATSRASRYPSILSDIGSRN